MANGSQPPPLRAPRFACDVPLLDHQEGSQADGRHGRRRGEADPFAQEDEGEDDGEHGARLIDRDDLVHVAELQGAEVAEPRRPRRQARQNQEQQAARVYVGDPAEGARDAHHGPGEDDHDDGAHGGGDVGVRLADPALGEYRRQTGEKGGGQSEYEPHTPPPSSLRGGRCARPPRTHYGRCVIRCGARRGMPRGPSATLERGFFSVILTTIGWMSHIVEGRAFLATATMARM